MVCHFWGHLNDTLENVGGGSKGKKKPKKNNKNKTQNYILKKAIRLLALYNQQD